MKQQKENTDWLTKILAYVDSPFKLIAIIIMAVVGFAGVMLYKNQEILLGAYKEHQKLPEIADDRLGLFSANVANNRDVVALMAGETPCGEYLAAQSEIGLWYIEQGMRYGCRISVPPDNTKFIGQITVGWKEQPADMDKVRTMLNIASNMLSKTKK